MSSDLRPNVLIIMSDQLKANALKLYGNCDVKSPNIDRLASKGTTYKNHYVAAPLCVPSRVALWTGIPVTKITEEESEKLLKMESDLEKKIVGQTEAVKSVVRAIKRSKVGLKDPKRPTGSFLFLGPTGVGK